MRRVTSRHTQMPNPNGLHAVLALLGALLVAGAHGQIYVVNQRSGTIGEYNLSGATIHASLISGLQSPTGLAIAGDDLYVAQENGIKILSLPTGLGLLVKPDDPKKITKSTR